MTPSEWITATTEVATAIGTIGTLYWAVRVANDSTREKLRIQVFEKQCGEMLENPQRFIGANSFEYQIENLGAQTTTIISGGLFVRQKNGREVRLHIGLAEWKDKGQRPDESTKILAGQVCNKVVSMPLEQIASWWDNRSRGSLWFDRPIIRLETSRGTIFKHRLSEEMWAYMQKQSSWEQERDENYHV